MKPEQFIREYGMEKAREVVEGAHSWVDVLLVPTGEYCSICIPPDDADEFVSIEDLKRLVQSLDLVEVCGGLVEAKKKMNSESLRSATIEYVLYKAIHDHESIYGGEGE